MSKAEQSAVLVTVPAQSTDEPEYLLILGTLRFETYADHRYLECRAETSVQFLSY